MAMALQPMPLIQAMVLKQLPMEVAMHSMPGHLISAMAGLRV
jgi:hypothetical protein